jgi:putative transposase
MPARNSVKLYLENSYYHIYNRGVEKREIFLDSQDYNVFLSYLKEYLSPKDTANLQSILSDPTIPWKEKDKALKLLRMNNFSEEITLLSFCLMPNHFHFFIKQTNSKAIDHFMQSLCTRYTMYFNRKYKRVGSLYQAVYKAALVTTEGQFLHLSRYIHKQALILQGETLQEQHPCSFVEYIGKRQTSWVKPQEVLDYFSKTNPNMSYQNFVKQQDDFEFLSHLTLED